MLTIFSMVQPQVQLVNRIRKAVPLFQCVSGSEFDATKALLFSVSLCKLRSSKQWAWTRNWSLIFSPFLCLDGVKVALDNRWVTVGLSDNTWNIGTSGEPWYICNWMSFTRPFLLGPVFFRTALPCAGGYHLERGGMQLHEAVGINCKGATA